MKQIEDEILEIHEVYPEYYNFIKNFKGTLTFDDGLYSQYLFLKNNPEVCSRSIVFISSDIVRGEYENPIKDIVLCDSAHMMHQCMNDNSAYMDLKEIRELKNLGVKIGYHGARHLCFGLFQGTPVQKLKIIRDDVILSICMEERENIFDDIFCSPYNDYESLPFFIKNYEKILNRDFRYVKDRKPLEEVIDISSAKLLINRHMFMIKPIILKF